MQTCSPTTNETVFPALFTISNQHYLRLYENKFRQLDLIEHMHQLRSNSKWCPFLLTNIRFNGFPTDFPLGDGLVPDFVLRYGSIVGKSMEPRKGHRTVFLSFLPHRLWGYCFLPWCLDGWVGGQREKVYPGCISETVRCRKLILGRDIG